jgi:hypothetical protein
LIANVYVGFPKQVFPDVGLTVYPQGIDLQKVNVALWSYYGR